MKKRRTTIQLIFKIEVCILSPLSPSWFVGTKYSLVAFQFCTLTPLIHKPNTSKIPQNYMITLKVSNPKYNQFFFFLELANTTRLNNLSPFGNSLTPNLELL